MSGPSRSVRSATPGERGSLSVLVVGAGLLGTSVGLAVRSAGWPVWMSDTDQRAESLACDLGAGEPGVPDDPPDLVLVAVPPAATAAVIQEFYQLFPNATFTDVASVKSQVLLDLETFQADSTRTVARSRAVSGAVPPTAVGLATGVGSPAARGPLSQFVGGHPLAGRERSGPEAARADLFEGQPWVLSPTDTVPRWRLDQVRALVEAAGGLPVLMGAAEHDAAVAVVSHLPQLTASALAARLVDAPDGALALAGSGLRDTTRVAASDPDLWLQILSANAGPVAGVLDRLADDLAAVAAGLRALSRDRLDDESIKRDIENSTALTARATVRAVLAAGQAGRARIPGKHGGRAVDYAVVPVVVPDEPGSLARLFVAAGEAGVNIEDVAIEHSPGQPVGLVELSVAPGLVDELTRALRERGWLVH